MNAAAQKEKNIISKEPLYLVDGFGFIFRAFHALPPLTNPHGVPVNAVMGFCNMLAKLLTDKNAHSVAVIFDASGSTFRNELYSEYKANRGETPEDLIPQFGLIKEAVNAFNLPSLEVSGYEADDLIATYARMATEQGRDTIIVSSDKDLMQLINDNVTMFDAMKNRMIGHQEVFEKFGVYPDKVVDIQALAGDSSDNIPGVPGIGVKTAALLIEEYDNLENLLHHAHEIKQNKRRENLIEFADNARLSMKLVTLDDQVPVPCTLDEIDAYKPDNNKLVEFLKEHGFKTTLARLESRLNFHAENREMLMSDAVHQDAEKKYSIVNTMADLDTWIKAIKHRGYVAIDTETDGLTPSQAKLVGISLCVEPGTACYIPLQHQTKDVETGFNFDAPKDDSKDNESDNEVIPQLALKNVMTALKPILEDQSILKIGHNIKFDLQLFYQHDVQPAPVDDTLLISYITDGTKHSHSMDNLCKLYFGHAPISFKEIAGTGKKQKTFDQIDIKIAAEYAAEDADYTMRLYNLLKPRLAEEQMMTIYQRVDRPLAEVIARMEHKGIKIDPIMLRNMSTDFGQKLDVLERKIHEQAEQSFNIASPKQLGEVLFDAMGIPSGKKSKTGAWSTAQSVLEPLAQQGHKIVQDVLEWRGLAKLKSTYTDALQNQIGILSGRVHTSFSMAATSTGRLASSDPNIQNIPIRTEEGRKIREAFIAEKGYKIASIDYSQVELRLAAELAGIESLKQAFRDGVDIHTHTASQVFDTPIDEVSNDLRRKAKAINFGIIYGISGWGLAKQIGADAVDANAYIKQYMARFPELEIYMESQKEFARKHGYVLTHMGRKCFMSGINDKNFSVRGFAERQAINAPLQGTAADIIKKAMIEIDRRIETENWPVKMLLQIHDELIFEIDENHVESYVAQIKDIMENVVSFSIPLIAEAGIGDNWAEAH